MWIKMGHRNLISKQDCPTLLTLPISFKLSLHNLLKKEERKSFKVRSNWSEFRSERLWDGQSFFHFEFRVCLLVVCCCPESWQCNILHFHLYPSPSPSFIQFIRLSSPLFPSLLCLLHSCTRTSFPIHFHPLYFDWHPTSRRNSERPIFTSSIQSVYYGSSSSSAAGHKQSIYTLQERQNVRCSFCITHVRGPFVIFTNYTHGRRISSRVTSRLDLTDCDWHWSFFFFSWFDCTTVICIMSKSNFERNMSWSWSTQLESESHSESHVIMCLCWNFIYHTKPNHTNA
jgi:hypothetical protein